MRRRDKSQTSDWQELRVDTIDEGREAKRFTAAKGEALCEKDQ